MKHAGLRHLSFVNDVDPWPPLSDRDPDQRNWMPAYAGILCGAATLFVMLRIWLRAMKCAGRLGIDDALLIAGWLCLIWFTILGIVDSQVYYTSRHIWDVPIDRISPLLEVAWMGELAYLFSACFVKTSVLLFHRRLEQALYTLAFLFALVFSCNPTEAYWEIFNPALSNSHHDVCTSLQTIHLVAGVLAAVGDLLTVALPCIIMNALPLSRSSKLAMIPMPLLGLLVVAASGVRAYYMSSLTGVLDVSTAVWNFFVWSQLELSLGIICACAPSLHVLFWQHLSTALTKFAKSIASGNSCDSSDPEQKVGITRAETSEDVSSQLDPDGTCFALSDDVGLHNAIAEDREVLKAWQPRESMLVRTPADYENYNLQTVEKSAKIYRESRLLKNAQKPRTYGERLRDYRERSKHYGQIDECELVAMPCRLAVKAA